MLFTLCAAAGILSCGGPKTGGDGSEASEWAFDVEKVWEMPASEEVALLRPAEPRVADDGTLYFHDFDQHLSYIVDANGKLVGTFAPRGSGEGEVSFYINCFTAGDHVVICAPDKLHFFTQQGQFVKAVPNNLFVRFPLAFRDNSEYWLAPGALGDSAGSKAVVTHVELASGRETDIFTFDLTDEEKKPTGGGVVPGLTPQAKMGFDRQSNRIYFGKNSDSVIYWSDAEGGEIQSFSFTADRRPVSVEEKRDHFAGHDVPEEHLAPMIAALPKQMAYYNRIQVIDGLVYLIGAESCAGNPTGLLVNIYDTEGRHLYFGRIEVEAGWHIFGTADNLQLINGFVFAVLENASGDKKIVKYQMSLPRP